jgi:hypothetical protein
MFQKEKYLGCDKSHSNLRQAADTYLKTNKGLAQGNNKQIVKRGGEGAQ